MGTNLHGVLALASTMALVLLGACRPPTDADGNADAGQGAWHVVQAYVESDAAWHARGMAISASDDSPEERARQREELGPHPDVTAAVAAARGILADPEHAQGAPAAEFLMEHPYQLSETDDDDMAVGAKALARFIGPDWSVVQDYQKEAEAWANRRDEIVAAELPDEERTQQLGELGDRAKGFRAIAAALAILEAGANDQTVAAAEFLVKQTTSVPGRSQYVYSAARALAANVPDYADWPVVLKALDWSLILRGDERIDAVIEELAESASDPVARATARYYVAAGLARSANDSSVSDEARLSLRERALGVAQGLSAGVEDEEFVEPLERGNTESALSSIAQAEAELVYRIKHATVGGMLPELAGSTVAGAEDNLSAYAGKVVLVDFWATWCGPCVAALPKLRELVNEHPAEHFALVAISIDATLEEVTTFQETEPMPWPNWYIGRGSEIERTWDVRVFPTYVLANEDGVILARTSRLDEILPLVAEIVSA